MRKCILQNACHTDIITDHPPDDQLASRACAKAPPGGTDLIQLASRKKSRARHGTPATAAHRAPSSAVRPGIAHPPTEETLAESPETTVAEQSAEPIATDEQPTAAELDQTIAALLNATDDRPSGEFYRTIAHTNAAIETTEADRREAQARAYDPKILDGTAAGRAHDCEYRLERLRRATEALDAAGKKAARRERVAEWLQDIDKLQQEVQHVAAEVAGRYTALAKEIVSLVTWVDSINRKVDAKNMEGYRESLPSQVSTVHLALGIASDVFQHLRLPELMPRGYGARDLWPRPQNDWVVEYHRQVAAAFRNQPVRTPEQIEAEKIAEAQKWMKFHEEQEAGRLRRNAEADAIAAAIRARQQQFVNGG